MLVKQFFIQKTAHISYLIAGKKECAIVDPARDVERYIEEAKKEGLTITHILETHLHADFVSGHLDLAEKTGAPIYAPEAGRCEFEHVPLKEGSVFDMEDMEFCVHKTPGHTPESVIYAVTDRSRGDDPVALFTGDTLFVGDVGRPDLFPGMAEDLAGRLYDSLHSKVTGMPDSTLVFPAHGSGSLCGKSIGEMHCTTIGYEIKYNSALLIKDRDEFIRSLTTGMPPAPDHFGRCSNINRRGPPLVRTLPNVKAMNPEAFREKMEDRRTIVLSVRDYAAFGGHHIPGSYSIDFSANFSTFAGWVIPPDRDILLVTENPKQALEAVILLRRVGLDRTVGYLDGGMHAWAMAGMQTDHVRQLSPEELNKKLHEPDVVLVDVRSPEEYSGGHVEGAINILAMDLRTRYNELDPEKPTIAMCGSGRRSSLACSLLKQRGFREVYNVAGGITGYVAAGFMKI